MSTHLRRAARPTVRHEARAETPGGSIAYTRAGAGPALLLIHGLGGHRQTWNHVVDTLARTHTVIAPDLPGHGESDAPAGDYSLGAHAAALRDLLFALDVSSVTLVGHSLGGGVALQFAYQFPERASRLVLIGSGGLGPEVSWALRIASMTPGAGLILKGLAHVPARITATVLTAAAVLPGVMPRQDTGPLVATLRGLATASQRLAFRRTARSVIDWSGQTVSATGKLDALHELPLLLIWGGRDRVIPPTHHAGIAERISRSRCLEIPEAGHFPHESDPDLVLRAIGDFLRTTTRFEFSAERHREALRRTSATEQVQPGTSPS